MIRTAIFLVVAAALAGIAPAQVAWVYDAATPGILHEAYLDSAAYPGGAPALVSPHPAPMSGILPPFGLVPAGGVGADAVTRKIYVTDGFTITVDDDPLYLGITPPTPPILPAPPLVPATLLPLTGLGVDAAGGVLWASSAGSFLPLPLAPPYVPLGPALPIPGLVGSAVSGLGYEASTGTLWACDVAGNVFHFTTAGIAIGPQPVAFAPSPSGLALCGLGIDEGNGPGAFPPPACSTQPGSHHVSVTDGTVVIDVFPGGTAPITIASASGFGGYGMDCLPDYQQLPGYGQCASGGTVLSPPLVGTTGPTYVGPGAFNGFALRGGKPGVVVDIWVDLCPIPGGLAIPPAMTLWLNPFSTSLAMGSTTTDAFGNATIPFSLVPAPPGIQLTFQWIMPDAFHPLGVCLTDAATFTTALR